MTEKEVNHHIGHIAFVAWLFLGIAATLVAIMVAIFKTSTTAGFIVLGCVVYFVILFVLGWHFGDDWFWED